MLLKSIRNICFVALCFSLSYTSFANRKLTENYISTFKNIAISEMRRTGIPASIKLAQGMLESDLGRSPLASKANNHFGIKCGKDWSGQTYQKLDDETDSIGVSVESCFRVFSSAEESYLAHSTFLRNPAKKSRYGFLFELATTDYVGWANGLKFAGYASDPSYPSKLIKIIENYQLYKYDELVELPILKTEDKLSELVNAEEKTNKEYTKSNTAGVKPVRNDNKPGIEGSKKRPNAKKYAISTINDLQMVYVDGGETISDVARIANKDVFDLMEYNEGVYSQDQLLQTGDIIFLQKKKKAFQDEDMPYHIVKDGESMYTIAQQYGIRLESLLSKNNMPEDAVPLKGQKISLHKNISKKDTPAFRIAEKFDSFVDLGTLK